MLAQFLTSTCTTWTLVGKPKNCQKCIEKNIQRLDFNINMFRVNFFCGNNDLIIFFCITKVSIRNKMIFSSNATNELPFNIAHM